MVCCPRRVSLCRMQLPEARFGPSVRRGLGAERPSRLRGHGCGLGAEGLRAPNPASPPRRTRGEWVSGTGDPQQSSRVQGARGSPAPLCHLESRGPGAKTACIAFLSKGAVGLVLLREECFLSLCRLQGPGTRLVPLGSWGLGAEWPSFTWAVLLGHGRRRPTHVQSCFPIKENM